jgi:uncharacterized membrane protein
LEPEKRIIHEPPGKIREAARKAMKGHMSTLIMSAALLLLCVQLPLIFIEQITGLWNTMDAALTEYFEMYSSFDYLAVNELAGTYAGSLGFSFASFLFVLFIPGPLTLGLSYVWLYVIRGKETFADMIFSGFGNFTRVVAMDTFRRILIFLWSILLVVPGIIAYYRYNLAFFLLADNPKMRSFEAVSLSKYYMQQNKGNRFYLDLSFIGWFALAVFTFYIINNIVIAIIFLNGTELTMFLQLLVMSLTGSIVFAPVMAYRGVAAAEYYHRVICRDPRKFIETE